MMPARDRIVELQQRISSQDQEIKGLREQLCSSTVYENNLYEGLRLMLVSFIEEDGLSNSDFARQMHMDVSNFTRFMSGAIAPNKRMIVKMLAYISDRISQ